MGRKMNERIRELALQAEWRFADRLTGEFSEYDKRLLKFAELIVRECAELYNHDDVLAPVGQSAWGEAYQDGWIEGTKVYRETMFEHFGVEE